MAERPLYYATEGDFVSNISHPFNRVLDRRPHLEAPFLRVLEAYENGRFEPGEEAPILTNIAFIDTPRNMSLVAEAYRVDQTTTINRWLTLVYGRPHLQEIVEEASVEKRIATPMTEGTFVFQQQAFTELFQETINGIPDGLLSDIERWVVDDVISGMTNQEIVQKYNYSMTQAVVKVLKRARRKIEEQVLSPAGIERATRFDFETVQGNNHTQSPIASAVQDHRLPGIKFLRMWYTHTSFVEQYKKERARIPDQNLLDQGFVLVCEYLDPDSKEYGRLVKSGYFDHILTRNTLVYIKREDMKKYLDGVIEPVYPTAPGPEFTLLVASTNSEREKENLRDLARTGQIEAIKHTNGWWYTSDKK